MNIVVQSVDAIVFDCLFFFVMGFIPPPPKKNNKKKNILRIYPFSFDYLYNRFSIWNAIAVGKLLSMTHLLLLLFLNNVFSSLLKNDSN